MAGQGRAGIPRYPGSRFQQVTQLPSVLVWLTDLPRPFTALEDSVFCQNHSCPVNYCYNHGHCYILEAPDCQPTCTCPPAFTDNRCLLAGNNFTPTISKGMTEGSCHASLMHFLCLGMMGKLVSEAQVTEMHRSELSFPPGYGAESWGW